MTPKNDAKDLIFPSFGLQSLCGKFQGLSASRASRFGQKKGTWKNPFLYRDAKPGFFFPLTPKNLGQLTWNLKLIQLKSKITLPETNMAPENRPSKRKVVFQPSIFRCKLSLSGRVSETNPSFSSSMKFYVNLQGSRPPFGQPLEPSIHLKEIRQHKPFLNVNTFEQRFHQTLMIFLLESWLVNDGIRMS